jgi:hypothetical protein
MSKVIKETLAEMADEGSWETRGWDDGMDFAKTLKIGIVEELATMRQLKLPQEYIDAWKASAQSIFYTLTDEVK